MSIIYNEIYKIVKSIPKGRVLTYGIISHLIGGRMSAQGVGWALMALGKAKKAAGKATNSKTTFDMKSVPWQRVVNSQGGTSTHKVAGVPPDLQRQLLEAEGIEFNDEGKMELSKYLWVEGTNASPDTKIKRTKKLP